MNKIPESIRKELAALAAKPESEIDLSDIAATTAKDWQGAARGRFHKPNCRAVNHGLHFCMVEVHQSETFKTWLARLKDRRAVARINARIRRLSDSGLFGDVKPAREGVSEMRIDYGPGYRLYFMRSGAVLIVLLAGGDKSTQEADIRRAIEIAKEWKD